MIFGIGADSGKSAAWALVSVEKGRLAQLHALEPIFGTRMELWAERAREGAEKVHRMAPEAAWWVERPPPRVKKDSHMAHHATGVGLGIRIGVLATCAHRASGRWPGDCEPGHLSPEQLEHDQAKPVHLRRASGHPHWWWYLGPKLILRAKTDEDHGNGVERIREASVAVVGAKEALAAVPEGRRVDCAESILIATARALATMIEQRDAARRA